MCSSGERRVGNVEKFPQTHLKPKRATVETVIQVSCTNKVNNVQARFIVSRNGFLLRCNVHRCTVCMHAPVPSVLYCRFQKLKHQHCQKHEPTRRSTTRAERCSITNQSCLSSLPLERLPVNLEFFLNGSLSRNKPPGRRPMRMRSPAS